MQDAESLKQSLGIQAKEIILNGLGIREVKGMVKCPLHNDSKASMSWFKDGLMFRCHACSEQIDIYRYYTEFERMSFVEAMDKVADLMGANVTERKVTYVKDFVKPNIQTKELSEKAIEYMKLRKIEKETLEYWKVKERKWNNSDVYVFNYYNALGEVEYVTYRGIGKGATKGGCEPNTKSILWGMNNIDKSKPVVIVEGQPDAMVVWQCGYKNVVTVPSGSKNLKWIDNCWEWLQDIKEFIVWADNDKSGMEMANEIKKRLNNVKITSHATCKDANEVLFKYGAKEVLKVIEDEINRTPNGLIDASRLEYKSLVENQNTGIETGFYEYDAHVEDWKEQELTVVFGRNGEGKTTFVSQIISHNIYKGVPVFLYSGEMSEQKIQNWLYRQVVGKGEKYYRYVQCKYGGKAELKPEVIKKLKEWHKDKFYLFDRNCDEVAKDINKFFGVMETAAARYGVKLFVIDNLMSKMEENSDSIYSDQSNFVQECKNFAIRTNTHVVLLAHPNKEKKELKPTEVDGNLAKTDISGSNNIPNKADNIISVERIFEGEEFDAVITSLKDRESGERKVMKFMFSKSTLRFYNDATKETFNFNWDKEENMKLNPAFTSEEVEECPF